MVAHPFVERLGRDEEDQGVLHRQRGRRAVGAQAAAARNCDGITAVVGVLDVGKSQGRSQGTGNRGRTGRGGGSIPLNAIPFSNHW